MGCPKRQRFASLGDAILVEASRERREALEHSALCPECRRIVREIDPSLAVADLPPVEVSRSEVEAVKRDVLAVRRMRRLDRVARGHGSSRRRWAAVAALTAGILLITEDTGRRAVESVEVAPSEGLLLSEDYRLFGALPLVESLEPSAPRIYQLDGEEDFSLVWIVDASLELSPR